MSRKMVSIREAAEFLGVAARTPRRWEREGRLLPDERTPGGRRRYDLEFHAPELVRRTIAYALVSSHDQKDDLAKDVLEIITVFSARLYGARSRKNQKLLDGVRAAVEASQC